MPPSDPVLVAEPVASASWEPFPVFCERVEAAVIRLNRHCRKSGLRRSRRLWCADFMPRRAARIAYGFDGFVFAVFGEARHAV